MHGSINTPLLIGEWRVDPASGQISRNETTARLDVRSLRLLLCLATHAGEVKSVDELLDEVWAGVTVSPDSVYQLVASLRRQLGDDPKEPKYIETVPRLGYRLVASVAPWTNEMANGTGSLPDPRDVEQSQASRHTSGFTSRFKAGFAWTAGAALCLVLGIGGWALLSHPGAKADLASQKQISIAVLPFLDLTEGMKEEEFADGMTEELIDRLSKVQGLRVSAPTSSFYFKAKQVPPAEIARQLNVAYLLDGSVRKSAGRVRVAARLLQAQNGYVLWTETYDRPFDDILKVQDDIAGQATKALKQSIGSAAPPAAAE